MYRPRTKQPDEKRYGPESCLEMSSFVEQEPNEWTLNGKTRCVVVGHPSPTRNWDVENRMETDVRRIYAKKTINIGARSRCISYRAASAIKITCRTHTHTHIYVLRIFFLFSSLLVVVFQRSRRTRRVHRENEGETTTCARHSDKTCVWHRPCTRHARAICREVA